MLLGAWLTGCEMLIPSTNAVMGRQGSYFVEVG